MTDVKFKPHGPRILVSPIETPREEKTASGLITAVNEHVEIPTRGRIIAKSDEVLGLNVGELVSYGHHSGRELKVDGVKYLLMREGDVDGIYLD